MAQATVLAFLGAILFGGYLVYLGLRHRTRSAPLGLLHASLALAGTALLFTQIASGPTDKMNNFAALFVILALVGGAMVFALREEGKPPSMMAVGAHAIMGLIGVSILLARLL